jgi:ABC-2 type transport system permease protein
MFNPQRLKALVIKEFHQIRRDPSSFLVAIIFPFMLLFLYGFGVSLDLEHLKIGVVLQDQSNEANDFYHCLAHSKYFDVHPSQNETELKMALTKSEISGIVIIPFYFSQFLERKEKAPIYVIADGESPNTASFVQNYITGAWLNFLIQKNLNLGKKTNSTVSAEPRFWFNPELSSRYFLIPGSIAIIMTLVGTLLTALVVAREWERGTIEAMLATPLTTKEFIFAKMIAYFSLGMGSFTFCFLTSIFLFQVPFRGSVLLLFICAAFFLFTALSGGLFIYTFTRDQFIASQIAIMSSFLPAYSLSGFLFEISSMPWIIQLISNFIPARYFVSCLQTLYLAGDVYQLIFFNILALLLIGLIPLIFTLRKSKKRLN